MNCTFFSVLFPKLVCKGYVLIVCGFRCLVVPGLLQQISSPHFEPQLLFRAVLPSVGQHPAGQVVEQVEDHSADISLNTWLRWRVGRWRSLGLRSWVTMPTGWSGLQQLDFS